MKPAVLLNFSPQDFSHKIDRAFRGVKFAFSSEPTPSALPTLKVGLSYCLDEAAHQALGGKLPAEALVLTVVSGYMVKSVNILGDNLVFADDYRHQDGLWFGYVNFRIMDFVPVDRTRDYYITVSLGTWFSDTLHIAPENRNPGARL